MGRGRDGVLNHAACTCPPLHQHAKLCAQTGFLIDMHNGLAGHASMQAHVLASSSHAMALVNYLGGQGLGAIATRETRLGHVRPVRQRLDVSK